MIGFVVLLIITLFLVLRAFNNLKRQKSNPQQKDDNVLLLTFLPPLISGGVLIIWLVGWLMPFPSKAEPIPSDTKAPKAVEITITGSNTLGKRLMPALVKGFMARNGYVLEKDSVISRPLTGEYLFFVHPDNKDWVNFRIESGGSLAGRQAMERASCDLAMASVPVAKVGKYRECKIGLDAIAVITHEDLILPEAMTLETLSKILCGEIKSWEEVNPLLTADSIQLMLRDNSSGTFKFLIDKLGINACSFDSVSRFNSNLNLVANVARTPFSIGFPSGATKSIGIQTNLIKIKEDKSAVAFSPNDPVAIQSGSYPVTRSLFLYYQLSASKLIIKDLIDFCLSIEGQNIVVQNGFIPSESNQVIEISNTEDRALTARGFSTSFPKPKRLSVDISFTPFDPKCPDVPTQASLSQLSILLKYLEKDMREIDTVFVLGIPDVDESAWRQKTTTDRRNFWVMHFLMQNIPKSASAPVFIRQTIPRSEDIPAERQMEIWVKKSNIYR